jgi:hypothetical protein
LLSLAKLRAGFDMQTNLAEQPGNYEGCYFEGIDNAAPTTLPG